MSRENVEIVRRAFEARRRGVSWAEIVDPEFEWDISAYPGLDMAVTGSGPESFVRFHDRYLRAWTDYEVAVKEFLDAGDDVVAVIHESARARGTEMLVERDRVVVWTIRAARPIRMRAYRTKKEALEAGGLRE